MDAGPGLGAARDRRRDPHKAAADREAIRRRGEPAVSDPNHSRQVPAVEGLAGTAGQKAILAVNLPEPPRFFDFTTASD